MALTAGVVFAASTWLMLSRDLKSVAMGVFLLGHTANLAIITVSRSPLGLLPPLLSDGTDPATYVDPLPQALILTAIVIAFATQAFLLTLLVVTWRRTGSLQLSRLVQNPDGTDAEAPIAYSDQDIVPPVDEITRRPIAPEDDPAPGQPEVRP